MGVSIGALCEKCDKNVNVVPEESYKGLKEALVKMKHHKCCALMTTEGVI